MNPRQLAGVGRFLPIGLGVEQPKYALGARHRGHRLAELLADGLDRTEKHVRQEEELDERANVHVNRGAQHAITADHDQRRGVNIWLFNSSIGKNTPEARATPRL